jgi:hypothetical protein
MNGSNPAHGDAKTKDAATECAEVFALPLRASRAHWDSQRLINAHGSVRTSAADTQTRPLTNH